MVAGGSPQKTGKTTAIQTDLGKAKNQNRQNDEVCDKANCALQCVLKSPM